MVTESISPPAAEAAWLVCHTKPRCEKKFAALLSAKKFEHYLPLVQSVRRYAQQTKKFTKPLFPGLRLRLRAARAEGPHLPAGSARAGHHSRRPAQVPPPARRRPDHRRLGFRTQRHAAADQGPPRKNHRRTSLRSGRLRGQRLAPPGRGALRRRPAEGTAGKGAHREPAGLAEGGKFTVRAREFSL